MRDANISPGMRDDNSSPYICEIIYICEMGKRDDNIHMKRDEIYMLFIYIILCFIMCLIGGWRGRGGWQELKAIVLLYTLLRDTSRFILTCEIIRFPFPPRAPNENIKEFVPHGPRSRISYYASHHPSPEMHPACNFRKFH